MHLIKVAEARWKQFHENELKVSIITIVRNGVNHIEDTINSVLNQSYENIQYIVIDGNSTDGTQHKIEKYIGSIDYYASEPDCGISDAWNKSLTFATGDIIGLINCADMYYPDAVESAVQALSRYDGIVYGDVDLVDDKGIIFRKSTGRFSLWLYSGGLGFWHPSVFATRSVYEKIGNFNTGMKYAMDTDWLLRAIQSGVSPRKAHYRVVMQTGGISVQNRYSAYGEHVAAMERAGVAAHVIEANIFMTGIRWLMRRVLAK